MARLADGSGVDMIGVIVSTRSGFRKATCCRIMPPIDAPTRCLRAARSVEHTDGVVGKILERVGGLA
jgi:hypothetical protein